MVPIRKKPVTCSGGDPRRRQDGEPRRGDRAEDHGDEAFSRFARLVLRFAARAGSDFQHFGRRDAFGIGQVGVRYQRASERDREQHAEHAAAQADEKRLPEGESRPPADDHETRQHEDDRRERAGRGRDGLDDVVLEDRRVLHCAQDRHRDHRRGDRRGEGEADLEAEVDVGRREDRRDERAENQAAYSEFFGFHKPHLILRERSATIRYEYSLFDSSVIALKLSLHEPLSVYH